MSSVNRHAYCNTFVQAKEIFENYDTFYPDDNTPVVTYAVVKLGSSDSPALTLNDEHFCPYFFLNDAVQWANFLQVIGFPDEITTSSEAKQHFKESVLVNSYYKPSFSNFFSKKGAEVFLEYFKIFGFYLQNLSRIYKTVIKEMKVISAISLQNEYPEVYKMFCVENDQLYSVLIRYEILIDDRIKVELQDLLPSLINRSSSYRIYYFPNERERM